MGCTTSRLIEDEFKDWAKSDRNSSKIENSLRINPGLANSKDRVRLSFIIIYLLLLPLIKVNENRLVSKLQ